MYIIMLDGNEVLFLFKLVLSMVAGFLIGIERESRGKSAGVSTHSFVVGGSMLFTYLSIIMDPASPSRIAAQIVTGIGFLGAGIILKSDGGKVTNLTTAASIWFSAAIGISIGLGMHAIAMLGVLYALIVPRIPHLSSAHKFHDK